MVQNEARKAARPNVLEAHLCGEEPQLLPGDHRGNSGRFRVVLLRGERLAERPRERKWHPTHRPG